MNEVIKSKSELLRAELQYVKDLHDQYPTTLEASQKSDDPRYAEKAFLIDEMFEKKTAEVKEFLFFHAEHESDFSGV